MDAWEEAYKLLHDDNNDRVTWVTAARALERGSRMANGITEEVHQDARDVQRDRYRNLFSRILGCDNPDIKGAFFYGAPDSIDNIDDAAGHSTKRQDERPQILNIPESVLKIIWDFAQFPKDYEDPLSNKKSFSDDDLNKHVNAIIWPGLFEYLKHQRR